MVCQPGCKVLFCAAAAADSAAAAAGADCPLDQGNNQVTGQTAAGVLALLVTWLQCDLGSDCQRCGWG